VPRNKDLITGVPRGTVYHQVANGGGGWGDPRRRDRMLLADEVSNGVISREAAMRDYGMSAHRRGAGHMNFDLSDDQRAIRDTFARFVDERVVPQAAALDEAHAFPRELFLELGQLGLFGLRYPESWAARAWRCPSSRSRWKRSRAARCRWPGRRRCSR
jgi:hypothetical protein